MATPGVRWGMSGDAGDLRATWERFFRAECEADLRELLEAYPRDRSLYVDVLDLYAFDEAFTRGLFSDPDRFLRAGADALRGLNESFNRVNVRLTNHPGLLGLGSLRARHVAELVTVEGVVASVDPVQAAVERAVYRCPSCGHGVSRRAGPRLAAPGRCEACDAGSPLELDVGDSTHVDVQHLVLEAPGGGRPEEASPPTLDAVVDDDLVATTEPGERLLATGIVRLERSGEANRFDFALDVVALDEEPGEARPTLDDASSELQRAIQSRWEVLTDG